MDADDTKFFHDGRCYIPVAYDTATATFHTRLSTSRARYQPRLYAFRADGDYIGPVTRPDNRIRVRFPATVGTTEHYLQAQLARIIQSDLKDLQPWERWVLSEYNGLLLSSLEKENQDETHPSLLQGLSDVHLLMRASSE